MAGFVFLVDLAALVILPLVLLLSPLSERVASRLSLIAFCSALVALPLSLALFRTFDRFPNIREQTQGTAAALVFTLSAAGFALGAGSLRRSRRRLLAVGAMLMGPPGLYLAFFLVLVGKVH